MAIKSTVMPFDRPLSPVGEINGRKRLEWTLGQKEIEEERSQKLDGRGPSIEMEEKMSHYSQHCPTKDFDKMKPIIIIIDSLVPPVPP